MGESVLCQLRHLSTWYCLFPYEQTQVSDQTNNDLNCLRSSPELRASGPCTQVEHGRRNDYQKFESKFFEKQKEILHLLILLPEVKTTMNSASLIPMGITVSTYSLLFNTSHGILIREKLDFPPNPFIPAWSLRKSLPCLLLHPGLKPFLFT